MDSDFIQSIVRERGELKIVELLILQLQVMLVLGTVIRLRVMWSIKDFLPTLLSWIIMENGKLSYFDVIGLMLILLAELKMISLVLQW